MTRDENSAASCMFTAYDALVGAAERFAAADMVDEQRDANALAREVAAQDPQLQQRVWSALPSWDEACARPEPIADELAISALQMYAVLEVLRRRGRARQRGGWWGRRGG